MSIKGREVNLIPTMLYPVRSLYRVQCTPPFHLFLHCFHFILSLRLLSTAVFVIPLCLIISLTKLLSVKRISLICAFQPNLVQFCPRTANLAAISQCQPLIQYCSRQYWSKGPFSQRKGAIQSKPSVSTRIWTSAPYKPLLESFAPPLDNLRRLCLAQSSTNVLHHIITFPLHYSAFLHCSQLSSDHGSVCIVIIEVALFCIILHYFAQFCIILHYFALFCTILHYFVLFCIILHYFVLFWWIAMPASGCNLALSDP